MWAAFLIPIVMFIYVAAMLWGLWLLLSSNAMLLSGSGSAHDRHLALIMDISIFAFWLLSRYRASLGVNRSRGKGLSE